MKRAAFILRIVLLILFPFFFAGNCVSYVEIPYPGLLYSNHKFAGHYNLKNNATPVKKARECMNSIFGLVATGNAGAGQIAESNNINKIAWVDHEFMQVMLIYYRYCTVVYGE